MLQEHDLRRLKLKLNQPVPSQLTPVEIEVAYEAAKYVDLTITPPLLRIEPGASEVSFGVTFTLTDVPETYDERSLAAQCAFFFYLKKKKKHVFYLFF